MLNPYLSQDCKTCFIQADCPGGSEINLYPGYWRSSITSLNIVQCTPYADSCLYYDLKRLRYLLILIYIGENMKANAKSDMLDLYAKPVMFLDKQSINHLDCFNVHHVEMKAWMSFSWFWLVAPFFSSISCWLSANFLHICLIVSFLFLERISRNWN